MAKEIERKFLVPILSDVPEGLEYRIVQGYLSKKGATVRVRVVTELEGPHEVKAFLTVKGPKTSEFGRDEWEYSIPVEDAKVMLDTACDERLIYKVRREVVVGPNTWEVDIFERNLKGLIVAELEIPADDHKFEVPGWVGLEVSQDKSYTNKRLSLYQFVPL